MSPFEVFRTPIEIRRFTEGFYLNGIWQEGSRVELSALLITGNIVNITFNGIALAPIAFSVTAAATMELIRAALAAQPDVQQVDISSDLFFVTVIPLQPAVSVVNSFAVTGGASQPSATISNSPTIIPATASVQPIGKDIKLVPEGRRNSAQFKFYSSTEIYGVTTQNPDQITVLKAPFAGLVYEVVNISDWQNNTNFDVVNHYKFVALSLQPLPGVG